MVAKKPSPRTQNRESLGEEQNAGSAPKAAIWK